MGENCDKLAVHAAVPFVHVCSIHNNFIIPCRELVNFRQDKSIKGGNSCETAASASVAVLHTIAVLVGFHDRTLLYTGKNRLNTGNFAPPPHAQDY